MQVIIEIKKHPNKDYTVRIYEGLNYFCPVFAIKRPTRWNQCITQIGIYLQGKQFINVFQKNKLEKYFKEREIEGNND